VIQTIRDFKPCHSDANRGIGDSHFGKLRALKLLMENEDTSEFSLDFAKKIEIHRAGAN
jgi:hypothetical protein